MEDRRDRKLSRLLLVLLHSMQKPTNISFTGMCSEVKNLWMINDGTFSHREHYRLHNYIRDNRPMEVYEYWLESDGYWWIKGDKKPRIEWVKEHIGLILKQEL